MELKEKLGSILPKCRLLENEPLSGYTSFRIGGPSALIALPETCEELSSIMAACREAGAAVTVLGNGTNVLVSDEGFDGVTVVLRKLGDSVRIVPSAEAGVHEDGTRCVIAGAGCSLTKIAMEAARAGLSGLEFAAGIPGSVGGAVVMNAGAYGGEIADVLLYATVLDSEGSKGRMTPGELELGYRHSCIEERGLIVTEACFLLHEASSIGILARIAELGEQRRSKQPLEYPSAGSTFKRPAGHFAGKLIEDAGLAGFRVGGAEVSTKHCGFVINKDDATAADVAGLIEKVRERVAAESGVVLEPEIRFVGRF